jgi:hypothetical protein
MQVRRIALHNVQFTLRVDQLCAIALLIFLALSVTAFKIKVVTGQCRKISEEQSTMLA